MHHLVEKRNLIFAEFANDNRLCVSLSALATMAFLLGGCATFEKRDAGTFPVDGGSVAVATRGCLVYGTWINQSRPAVEPALFTVLGLDQQGNTLASASLSCSPAVPGRQAQCSFGTWSAPGTMNPYGAKGMGCSNIVEYNVIEGVSNGMVNGPALKR